uniref:PHD-type domain-containing protein n=1 Tax=Graphocephala atropunctata TaxID=36148 RepID=A0A1B6KAJ5_9HEMI
MIIRTSHYTEESSASATDTAFSISSSKLKDSITTADFFSTMVPVSKPNACPVCVKYDLYTEKSIGCQNGCDRWFHKECVKLSDDDYDRLASDNKIKWICNRADCTPESGSSSTSMLETMYKQIDDLAIQVKNVSVSNEISALRTDVSALTKSITEIEPRLLSVEKEVKAIQEIILNWGNQPDLYMDQIYFEVMDRTDRSQNVLLFKVPESKSFDAKKKRSHDVRMLFKLFSLTPIEYQTFSFHRLGKPHSSNPRPIKVAFHDSKTARAFIRHFSQDIVANADKSLAEVTVSHDRTPQERDNLNQLRKTLEDRIKNGERDLTIKFINNVPQIVKKQKN